MTAILDDRKSGRALKAAQVVITFGASGDVSDHVGDTSSVRLTGARMAFQQGWANDLVAYPGPKFDIAEQRFVFGKVLTGTVEWSIAGERLALVKPGVGAVHLRRIR